MIFQTSSENTMRRTVLRIFLLQRTRCGPRMADIPRTTCFLHKIWSISSLEPNLSISIGRSSFLLVESSETHLLCSLGPKKHNISQIPTLRSFKIYHLVIICVWYFSKFTCKSKKSRSKSEQHFPVCGKRLLEKICL
jgi:hypothetical protein